MTLSNLPIVIGITLGGALCMSAHGSGVDHGVISGQMIACRIIDGRGDVVCVDENGPNARLLPAVRVSLGALGILSTVTLRTVPARKLHVREFPMTLDACLSKIDTLKAQYEYFKAWWVPHTDFVHVFLIDRSPDLMDKPETLQLSDANPAYSNGAPIAREVFNSKKGAKLVNSMFAMNAKDPSTIPFANHALREVLFLPKRCCEDSSTVLTNGHWPNGDESEGCRFDVLEYALPACNVALALEEYRKVLDEQGLYVSFPVDVRFSKRDDDCWLSPAFGFDAAWIGIPAKRPNGEETSHTEEFREFERVMIQFGGRPHWAKQHSLSSSFFASSYPHWDDFLQIRAELDPYGIFLNPYLREMLGLPLHGNTAKHASSRQHVLSKL